MFQDEEEVDDVEEEEEEVDDVEEEEEEVDDEEEEEEEIDDNEEQHLQAMETTWTRTNPRLGSDFHFYKSLS